MKVKLISITPNAEETMVEIARVSSPNPDNKDTKLLNYCLKHKHWSVFEHAHATIQIETSRTIGRQILRHRSFSFSEFCVAGDTKISCGVDGNVKLRTIAELFRLQKDTRWHRNVRVYDQDSNTIISAKVKEVFETGLKKVFRLTLENGKQITATEDHKFLTSNGFQRLAEISEESFVGCNGVACYQDYDWMAKAKKQSIEERTGVHGMAEKAGCSYHTIRKWLKKLGLSFTKKEVSLYTDIWNKGLPSDQQPMSGKLHSDDTRLKMQQSSKSGQDSNFYVDGGASKQTFRQRVWSWQNKYRNKLLVKYQGQCATCHSTSDLGIDHIIPVSTAPDKAFDYDNLQILCSDCHNEKDTPVFKSARFSKVKSIEPAGIQQTYDMEIDHTDHNYVANGMITHNSQRYAQTMQYEKVVARKQAVKNRQSSTDDLSPVAALWFTQEMQLLQDATNKVYTKALEIGIAKETARFALLEVANTRMYMTGNIRSWIHYTQLRCKEDTQLEHREIALAIRDLLYEHLPTLAGALEQ